MHSLTSVYIYGKIRVQLSQKFDISRVDLCWHDSAFWKTAAQISCEECCTFSCTERIVEAAVSDSPPDLPITDMQSGFPQLFCSAGPGFSFTRCIRCQKNKRVSVYCRHRKKNSDSSLPLGAFIPNLNFFFLNTSSSFPQPFLHVIRCCWACNTQVKTYYLRDDSPLHIMPASTYILIRVESENLCALVSFNALVKTDGWWSFNSGSHESV